MSTSAQAFLGADAVVTPADADEQAHVPPSPPPQLEALVQLQEQAQEPSSLDTPHSTSATAIFHIGVPKAATSSLSPLSSATPSLFLHGDAAGDHASAQNHTSTAASPPPHSSATPSLFLHGDAAGDHASAQNHMNTVASPLPSGTATALFHVESVAAAVAENSVSDPVASAGVEAAAASSAGALFMAGGDTAATRVRGDSSATGKLRKSLPPAPVGGLKRSVTAPNAAALQLGAAEGDASAGTLRKSSTITSYSSSSFSGVSSPSSHSGNTPTPGGPDAAPPPPIICHAFGPEHFDREAIMAAAARLRASVASTSVSAAAVTSHS